MTKCPHSDIDDFFSGESPGPSDSEYVRKSVVLSKIKNLRAKKNKKKLKNLTLQIFFFTFSSKRTI